jgi:hypothetical protein
MATRKKAEPKEEPVVIAHPVSTPKKKKIGKLVSKNKKRLPRKEKKAAKKRLLTAAD